MSRPLLVLAGAVAVGAAAGPLVAPGQAAALLALSAALIALSLAAPPPAASAALAAGALALGAAAAGVERAEYERAPLRAWLARQDGGTAGPVQVEGVAVRDGRPRGDRLSLLLEVETVRAAGHALRARGRARVEVGGQGASERRVREGERVRVWAQLSTPRARSAPGAYDPAAQAFRDGVHAYGFCKSALLLETEARPGPTWPALAAGLRAWARRRLDAALPPGQERALVRAMVLGDRAALDEDTAEAFRAAGTYHVLALSGAQVALLAGLLGAALRPLRLAPAASALLICAGLAFYAEVVGGEVPVVRAAVMASVLLAGRALSLDADLANLLGLAALGMLALRPSAVADVSFQLSFAATLGILSLTPVLLRRVPRLPLRLDLAVAGSLAAQLMLAPLLAAHFHRLAPAALVLNLAAVPLSAAVLLSGLAVIAAPPLEAIERTLAGLSWAVAHGLLRSADPIRWLPALDVRVPAPAAAAVLLHAAGLALLARRGPRAALVPLALSLASLAAGVTPPADGRLHLVALDVGQGDALVLHGPSGRVWVVDAGPAEPGGFDAGAAVVGPYLRRAGVRRLDRILVTHAHPDHAGGVPALLRGFAVGEVWEGPAAEEGRTRGRLEEALLASRAGRRTVIAGLVGEWDGARVEVLWPRRPARRPPRVRNDDSVVMRLTYGQTALLLAADLERGGEAMLPPAAAAVLKVPHHGSRSSSTAGFVAAVSPRLAIVSAGLRNRHGHPHPEVVERYRRAGAEVLRTDLEGTIRVSSDGHRLWVSTFRDGLERRIR